MSVGPRSKRRRTIVRSAFVAYAVLACAACIFDQSKYEGGGRIDQGGVAREDTSSTATTEPTTTTTATTTTRPDTGALPVDSGTNG